VIRLIHLQGMDIQVFFTQRGRQFLA